ncbi:MAG: DUF1254 domain-containing protein [Candidatus Nitrosopolaris sp.]
MYSIGYLDLKNGPIVLQVPPISDRCYSVQFVDIYLYIGTRMSDTTGGTYLVSGSNWHGEVPSGMKEIKVPANLVVIN